jgi:hypothetical protein
MEARLINILKTTKYSELTAIDSAYVAQYIEDEQGFEVLQKMNSSNVAGSYNVLASQGGKAELDKLYAQTYGATGKSIAIWKTNTSFYLQPILWGAAACLALVLVRVNVDFSENQVAKKESVKQEVVVKPLTAPIEKPVTEIVASERPMISGKTKSEIQNKFIAKQKTISSDKSLESTLTFGNANVGTNDQLNSAGVDVEAAAAADFATTVTNIAPAANNVNDRVAVSQVAIAKKANTKDSQKPLVKTKRLIRVNVNDGLYYMEVGY